MKRDAAFDRLRRIRDEYEAVRFSLGQTLRALQSDTPTLHASISQNRRLGEFQRAVENIEKTYIVRLFSEFEGIAVHYHRFGLKRPTKNPLISRVLTNLRDRQKIDSATSQLADEVRTCRNNIVHLSSHTPALDFHTCKSRLGKFLARLPQTWPDA